ncbi:MAG: hypothetical protein ACU0CY_08765 [Maritimibacter harenae]
MSGQANGPVIIKKVKKSGGEGHHGGAWKVAIFLFLGSYGAVFRAGLEISPFGAGSDVILTVAAIRFLSVSGPRHPFGMRAEICVRGA